MPEVSTTFLDFVRLKNSTQEDFWTILDPRVAGQFEPKCEEFRSKGSHNRRCWMLSCFSRKAEKNRETVWRCVFHYFEVSKCETCIQKLTPIAINAENLNINSNSGGVNSTLCLRMSEALPRAILQWWMWKSCNSNGMIPKTRNSSIKLIYSIIGTRNTSLNSGSHSWSP